MSIITIIYTVALFVLLMPGLLFKLPGFGKPIYSALLHFLLFIVLYNIINLVLNKFLLNENFASRSARRRINRQKAFLSNKNNAKSFLKSIMNPGQLSGIQALYSPLRD